MSTASPPILAYASPAGSTRPDAAGEISLSFPPPPIAREMLYNLAGFIAAAFGLVIFGIAAIGAAAERRPEVDSIVTGVIGLAIMAPLAWTRLTALHRVGHFGHLPVTIELRDGIVTVTEPTRRWRSRVRQIPASQVGSCSAVTDGIVILGPRIFYLRVRYGGYRTHQVRVAAANRAVVVRAADDLHNACRAAAGSSSAPADDSPCESSS